MNVHDEGLQSPVHSQTFRSAGGYRASTQARNPRSTRGSAPRRRAEAGRQNGWLKAGYFLCSALRGRLAGARFELNRASHKRTVEDGGGVGLPSERQVDKRVGGRAVVRCENVLPRNQRDLDPHLRVGGSRRV